MARELSKAALGWVVDTEQWQEGLRQEYRLSVKMAPLQGKRHANRLILISWNIQPGYYTVEFTFWQRQLRSLETWLFWWWNNTRKFKLHYIFYVLSLLNIQSTNCAHIFKPPEIATASQVWEAGMRIVTFQQVMPPRDTDQGGVRPLSELICPESRNIAQSNRPARNWGMRHFFLLLFKHNLHSQRGILNKTHDWVRQRLGKGFWKLKS